MRKSKQLRQKKPKLRRKRKQLLKKLEQPLKKLKPQIQMLLQLKRLQQKKQLQKMKLNWIQTKMKKVKLNQRGSYRMINLNALDGSLKMNKNLQMVLLPKHKSRPCLETQEMNSQINFATECCHTSLPMIKVKLNSKNSVKLLFTLLHHQRRKSQKKVKKVRKLLNEKCLEFKK